MYINKCIKYINIGPIIYGKKGCFNIAIKYPYY